MSVKACPDHEIVVATEDKPSIQEWFVLQTAEPLRRKKTLQCIVVIILEGHQLILETEQKPNSCKSKQLGPWQQK